MKPYKKYSAEELLHGITNSNPEMLKLLYSENYSGIRHFVLLNSGNEDDAKDVFQETLVIFYLKIKKPGFKLTSSIGTYLYSIGKFLWLKELERRRKTIVIEDNDVNLIDDNKEVIELIERNDRLQLYREKFEELSNACKQVIKMYLNKIPIKEITQLMGYSSDQHTKNRYFRCKLTLINKIKQCKKYKELGNG